MSGDTKHPDPIDPTKANVARVYDYALGGKNNFPIDREMWHRLCHSVPEAALIAHQNKAFGNRVIRYVAEQGVRQFLDLGSGIPTTPPSTHDTARAVSPDAAVVYIDNDPVVVAHSQALRDIAPGLLSLRGDLTDPDSIMDHPDVTELIDFGQPVGILMFSVLQTVLDNESGRSVIRRIRDRMAPGSYLGLSHISAHSTPEAIESARHSSEVTGYPPFAVRDDTEIAEFLTGFDILEPGIVDIDRWHNEDTPPKPTKAHMVGALGRLIG